MRRVLITGGLGFVGTQLLDILSQRKDLMITVLDNLTMYSSEPLPRVASNNFIIFGDIRDETLVANLVANNDMIIHLAGIVGYPACAIDPDFSFDVNIRGTCNIINHLSRNQKFVFISSTSVYGNKDYQIVTEESKPAPLTEYGRHKVDGELATLRAQDNGVKCIILRPATAFGLSQRVRVDLLPNTLIYDALVKKRIDVFQPNVIRPFLHVLDFSRILEYTIDEGMEWNQTYNIGNSDLTMTKGNMAKLFAEWAGAKVYLMDGTDPDQRNYDVSFSKLESTGFQFLPDTLYLGFTQMSLAAQRISEDYNNFSTYHQTLKYLSMGRH